MTLPLDRQVAEPSLADGQLVGRRALIVDDMALNCTILDGTLGSAGLCCEIAPSGKAALATCKQAL